MRIDRDKNQADKAKLLENRNINDTAFARGLKDFFNGKKVITIMSSQQYDDAVNRISAVNNGDKKRAFQLTKKLMDQGLFLEDEWEGERIKSTVGYIKIDAECPYYKGSMYAKEWQRGYNYGFAKQLKFAKQGKFYRPYKKPH